MQDVNNREISDHEKMVLMGILPSAKFFKA